MSKYLARWFAMGVVASVAALSAAPASAQATLDTVKKRGKILCGGVDQVARQLELGGHLPIITAGRW